MKVLKTATIAAFTVLLFALFASCGGSGDGGSGGCEESSGTHYWCHNFRSTSSETGEEICVRIGGDWVAGSSCSDLGYTTECPDGSWVRPSGSCL